MKKILTLCILNLMMLSASRAESIAKPFNDLGYGTLSGRGQSLSMYRDFETGGKGNGINSTLGVVLGYTSPEIAGFDAGLAYNYAFQLAKHDNWYNRGTRSSPTAARSRRRLRDRTHQHRCRDRHR